MNYFLLILFWIIYYAVHSILASTQVKEFFRKKIGKYFRYYRLAYSVFATITLIFLLFFQYSFYSPFLIKSFFLKYFSTLFLVLPGLVIMFISIKKYFMLLSGVRSIFIATPPIELKVTGIHRFVRHPLYLGTILFVCGLFFLFPTISNLIAVVLLIAYVLTGIIFEEKKLIKEFGKTYEEYILKVPMLIPIFKNKKNRN
ncbi:MAG TPA: isoprenylcysteine carboxylmethyltransferase family protein [Hanamia sp.]|nr:isoprenylcysteine carboxylmethyltransferase family protein [Hanamia sp.]